jgi:hypothetical protein
MAASGVTPTPPDRIGVEDSVSLIHVARRSVRGLQICSSLATERARGDRKILASALSDFANPLC